jgi:hypothetical protein
MLHLGDLVMKIQAPMKLRTFLLQGMCMLCLTTLSSAKGQVSQTFVNHLSSSPAQVALFLPPKPQGTIERRFPYLIAVQADKQMNIPPRPIVFHEPTARSSQPLYII